MAKRFIGDVGGKYTVPLKDDSDKTVAHLLWGDPVTTVGAATDGYIRVTARGRSGWVPTEVLTDEGLLELYVIDVGQGDGVLMRTPDDKWHLIDAGVSNEVQMTKKGTANFIRWKFIEDLGLGAVRLENVILSHPDFDHYGGLIDLFEGKVSRPDRTFAIHVEHFYHNGLGRWETDPKIGQATEGSVAPLPYAEYGISQTGSFVTELLSGKSSFKSPPRPFEQKVFAPFAKLVAKVPQKVRRLSGADGYLPGYEEDSSTPIRVLGPIVETLDSGEEGLRELGNVGQTSNGHSIVLRVDYGKARILLTGDLNTTSQRLLLSYQDPMEFSVDVAKGCHHGSDDIDLRFVRAMQARTTIVSSGDNEDYAHPRPRVMGASARYGRESKHVKGETLPPLLYSTELARSVKLAYASSVRSISDATNEIPCADAEVKPAVSKGRYVEMENIPVAMDLIYGLINVRTDGERVLCANMMEQSQRFDIQVFRAGVEP